MEIGALPQIGDDFFYPLTMGSWCTDVAPAFLSLVEPIVRSVIIGNDEMGNIPFIEYGIQEASLNFIFKGCYFFVFFLHFQSRTFNKSL